jgi:hypothetical protein
MALYRLLAAGMVASSVSRWPLIWSAGMNAMDNPTSKEAFANYHRWQKHIKNSHPNLPDRHTRDKLLLYCWAMADEGTNGIGCYAGNAYIAEMLEWNRDTVAKYKTLAIELGWFVLTGKRKGRAPILDVNIPSLAPAAPVELADVPKPVTRKPVSVPQMPAKPRSATSTARSKGRPEHEDKSVYECAGCQSGDGRYPTAAVVNDHDAWVIAHAQPM